MNSTIAARLAALEARAPAREPFAVDVTVHHDGTSVGVCYPLPDAHTDTMTLGEYRARFDETYRAIEYWLIADDAQPVEDQLCTHWPYRGAAEP